MGLSSASHLSQAIDDVLGDATVLGELPAQLFDHAIDEVQLLLVARRGRQGHAGSVHGDGVLELLLLAVELGRRRRRRLLQSRDGGGEKLGLRSW